MFSTHLEIVLAVLQSTLHNLVQGVTCTSHRCPSMLFCQNLHCNISTVVMHNSFDFLWWNVEIGNNIFKSLCNICSCVSLFKGHRRQAVGLLFPILPKKVTRYPQINLLSNTCPNVGFECLLKGFLQLAFNFFIYSP